MIRNYYIVIKQVRVNKNYLPVFITCAFNKDGEMVRIDDLIAYQENGGGLTDEKVDTNNTHTFTINGYDWERVFRLHYGQ